MPINMNLNVSADKPIPVKVMGDVFRGIIGAKVDEATGRIALIFNDGGVFLVPGRVVGRGIKSGSIRPDRHLIFTMDDGTTEDVGVIPADFSDEAKQALRSVLDNALFVTDPALMLDTLYDALGLGAVIVNEFAFYCNLHNCVGNVPSGTKIRAGSGFSMTVTPNDGYTLDGAEVILTVNGENVTDKCYSNGVVDIPEVNGDVTLVVAARSASAESFYVYSALVNMTSSTPERVEVNKGDSYEATLTPNYGYTLDGAELTVKMAGEDITATAYSGGRVYIESVTGEVHIEGEAAEQTKFSITNNLTGATTNNTAVSVYSGKSYSAKITALTGYTMTGAKVSVTMGGVDVSSTYANGTVYISAVTGDIVITVEAVEVKTYGVKYMLTGCVSTNTVDTVTAGSTFITNIATLEGYTSPVITVTVGGDDVTSTVLNGTAISIVGVSGDIVIQATAEKIPQDYYQVTATTSKCVCILNEGSTIPAGSFCSGHFLPAENFSMFNAEVHILMGNKELTDSVYDEDTAEFYIPVVTDNITITANAVAELS